MEVLFLLWPLFGVVAGILAASKGRHRYGWFVLGCLFGPVSLMVALMPAVPQPPANAAQPEQEAFACPACGWVLSGRVARCPWCHTPLTPEMGDHVVAKNWDPPISLPAEVRLRALETLKAKGLLSDGEYMQQRTEILKEL